HFLLSDKEEKEKLGFSPQGGREGNSIYSLRRGILHPFHSSPPPPGFLCYGYDGMDFISFDKETLRWMTAQPLAQKVKEEWEEDPRWSQESKVFLEEICIAWLQRYLSYKKTTLEKIEPPVGKVTHKVEDERLEVLTCQAFGFYPKEIQATWTRDGEACKYETLLKNVAPNSDGTYYVQLSIEIDPKERDHFRCHLEHEGLQEPLDLAFKEERGESCYFSFFSPDHHPFCFARRFKLARKPSN
uniref:Ig-like domain-containing protein n=1 Tax=Pseudonaja textilis TaxID=8673 RepID=A0A670ZNT0_PSETE